jgi:Icc protein
MAKNCRLLHVVAVVVLAGLTAAEGYSAPARASRPAPDLATVSRGLPGDSLGITQTRGERRAAPSAAAAPARRPPVDRKIGDKLHLFVFAAIGDSHIRFDGGQDARYLKDMDDAQALLGNYALDINAHAPPVDFAVQLGDVTDLGKPEEFSMASQALSGLDCHLYAVLGNHDNFQSDHKAGWLRFAGVASPNYAFDVQGFHFIVIDCTLDPYVPPYVDCGPALREWVADDLAANRGKPTIVFSHFNMWERPWNPMFDTTLVYAEYRGMPELRRVLEASGSVVAVVNGHVHANRVEYHNGIYYVDVGATLVGPPSVRYFCVYPDRIEVTSAYISNQDLFTRVTALCPTCSNCFNPNEVCAFIDGRPEDRQFVIPIGPCAGVAWATDGPGAAAASLDLAVTRDGTGRIKAVISSDLNGLVEVSLVDVLGRRLGRCNLWKDGGDLETDLTAALPVAEHLPAGIYFLRAAVRGAAATSKLVLIP